MQQKVRIRTRVRRIICDRLASRDDRGAGYTLLEIVTAVSIVLILGVVGMISYGHLASHARDAVRVSHAQDIAMALQMYAEDHGHLIGSGSGCGFGGNGTGWFNRGGEDDPEPLIGTSDEALYGGYQSIADCLVEAGLLSANLIDPSGRSQFAGASLDDRDARAYLKYNCERGATPKEAFVFVRLENVDREDRMEPNFECEYIDSLEMDRVAFHYDRYDMNYWVKVSVL